MYRFLGVLVVVVALGVGLAFYLGWVKCSTDSATGNFSITFMVDKEKYKEDEQKAIEKVHDVGHSTKE